MENIFVAMDEVHDQRTEWEVMGRDATGVWDHAMGRKTLREGRRMTRTETTRKQRERTQRKREKETTYRIIVKSITIYTIDMKIPILVIIYVV